MIHRVSTLVRCTAALVLSVVALGLSQPAAAQSVPDEGPGGPILIINSPTSTYGSFYTEVLRNEGFNQFAVENIANVSAVTLQNYDVVILAEMPLAAGQVQMLSNWVNAGGNLIAMRPAPGLASLLGITISGSPVQNGYLLVNTAANTPGFGIVGETIQYFGPANRHALAGATEVARLFTAASTPTASSAITLRNVGTAGGQAVGFSYDLATSLVYARQGNPAWDNQERDGFSPIRSDDLYFGDSASDPQPDWVNLDKVGIPQADEQQRLLANLIQHVNKDRKPLPRFWYFPRDEKAVVVMTGDDHANNGTQGRFDQFIALSPPGCSVADWECVRGTSYIYPGTPLSSTNAAAYAAQGFEVGLHVNTNCGNYTASSLESFYSQQIAQFGSAFPGLPPLSTQRHHCIAWSDWATGAKVQYAHGMRLDTTYYFWPASWVENRPGFMTGSAMPMRFADLDGSLIDVYQAATQMTDESGQVYPYTANELLDWALGPEGYYGAFTANMHTDVAQIPQNDAIVNAALARGVPVITADQLLQWLDGRNASSFGAVSRTGNTVLFTVDKAQAANGLRGYIPLRDNTGEVASITRNDVPIAFAPQVVKGSEQAFFNAQSGNYVVTYQADTTPPSVVATDPVAGSTDVSRFASVSADLSESVDPATVSTATVEMRDSGGVLVETNVSYDVNIRRLRIEPSALVLGQSTTYTVTVQGGSTGVRDLFGNALPNDFSWSFTTNDGPDCPCTGFAASEAPSNSTENDSASTELGVKFTVDLDGYVSGIRFYKGTGNEGPHAGSLWNEGGDLLATALFTNETSSGWQQVDFDEPVPVTAGTVYVASYHAPSGRYASDEGFFATTGVDSGPVNLLQDGVIGRNGVYAYSTGTTFPSESFGASNYWVDVVYSYFLPDDSTPPLVTSVTPSAGATNVGFATTLSATFSEAMNADSISGDTIELTAPNTAAVASSVIYDASSRTAMLTPNAPLLASTTYTATINGGPGGVRDLGGNTLAVNFEWSFATASPDTTAPTVTSVSPPNGSADLPRSIAVTATFSEPLNAATLNASTFELRDSLGGIVPSTIAYDVGQNRASLTSTAALAPLENYTATIRGGSSGVLDLGGNSLSGDVSWSFTTGDSTVYTSWSPDIAPTVPAASDSGAVELGVKFTVDIAGAVTGIRFYKGPGNTGTHVGSLWTADGNQLASAVFTNETATGWQQIDFATPVPVNPNTVYVASYHAPNGHYALDANYFANGGVETGPVNLLQDGVSGGNGLYVYAANSQFPTASWQASNYWVDIAFATSFSDSIPPTVTNVSPADGSASVETSTSIVATFDEAVDPATITPSSFELIDALGASVPAALAYDGNSFVAVLTPAAPLVPAQTYTARLQSGATGVRDLAGNTLSSDYTWTFATSSTQTYSAWGPGAMPTTTSENDPNGVELGVKFTVDTPGAITGLKFYKGVGNSGTHVGNLWTSSGQLLATAIFVNETASGWQSVSFSSPVQVNPGAVYVGSYYAPNGRYSVDPEYFAVSGVDGGPVNLLQSGASGGNGVYAYGAASSFPTSSWNSSNYWVDIVFAAATADTTAPTVVSVSPSGGSTNVTTIASVNAVFDEDIDSSTLTGATFELRDSQGILIPAAVSYNAATRTTVLTPSFALAVSQPYTARVRGGASGIRDVAGNAMAADHTWSFTTSGEQVLSVWGTGTVPPVPSENDPNAVELGVKFTVDSAGAIAGIRFYKGAGNTGMHIGNLWTSGGQLLASTEFVNETSTGWQQVNFGSPVAVFPGNVYIASYHAPNGNYASSSGYFANSGVDAGPVNLLQDGTSGGNGVYSYSVTSTFPTSSWQASNYWVDVIYSTSTLDNTAPSVAAVLPANGSFDVSAASNVVARFNESVNPSSVTNTTFELLDAGGIAVPATVSYDQGSMTAALDPVDSLELSATYTAIVRGGSAGVRDLVGNPLATDYAWSFTVETTAGSCTSAPNAIVAENCLPGNPPLEWQISGVGDPSIQGFATEISVDQGETVSFKIDTDASAYSLEIYRLGYYGGLGARRVATVSPSASLPQNQPTCLNDATTGLIDCGNWGVSASWQVPSAATSGIYIARAERTDTGGASHIVFVVRDDDSTSDLLFQTSDTTWQAYNSWGGNSLYVGAPAGRAYKVSYNRPFNTRIVDNGQDWLFNAEYPMVRWLESNGYDVSYSTGVDSDRRGGLIQNHRVFLSVGHDEYWSGPQRENVEIARDSGVNLAFFSGNEIFWKTRWEPSIDGAGQAYRTLVTYKETLENGNIDPQSPPTWTGTWRDPRFSPPADGGRPENALSGTMFLVNSGTSEIRVPAEDGKMRFWRNTSVANLAPGTFATLADSTLGYEWDADFDNGFRPAGLVRLSTTTETNVEVLLNYGSSYGPGTATHHLTLYKVPSGALVFGAGTIQWSWGLDVNHDRGGSSVPDIRMQQASVNLLADMSAQPVTLQPGLFPASASSDSTAPSTSITTPANGANVAAGSPVTISGTASDAGGGVVGAVEVSTDGGASWRPAQGREDWSYTWTPESSGSVGVRSRAADDSGNLESPGAAISVTVN